MDSSFRSAPAGSAGSGRYSALWRTGHLGRSVRNLSPMSSPFSLMRNGYSNPMVVWCISCLLCTSPQIDYEIIRKKKSHRRASPVGIGTGCDMKLWYVCAVIIYRTFVCVKRVWKNFLTNLLVAHIIYAKSIYFHHANFIYASCIYKTNIYSLPLNGL